MPRRFTVKSLEESPFPQRVGDVVFFPRPMHHAETSDVIAAWRKSGDLTRILPPFLRASPEALSDQSALFWVMTAYRDASNRLRHEPRWARHAPVPLRRHLRNDSMHYGYAYDDPLAILPTSRYDGLRYLILEGGLTHQTMRAFPEILRLHGIRQLGYLHHALSWREDGTSTLGNMFSHTRYAHVLRVMAVFRLLAVNAKLPLGDQRIGAVAALTHDVCTPAGGDTTKLLDPKAFDEDAHYGEWLRRSSWELLHHRYGLDPERLIQTVQGEGLLGELLDIADKLAYTGDDVCAAHAARVHRAIRKHVELHPAVCSVWDAVRVIDGRAVFIDTARLAAFLKLRALMFKHLYWNPQCRHLEFLLGRTVMRYLYDTGALTRDALLKMSDNRLDLMIGEFVGMASAAYSTWAYGLPCVETFATLDQAKRRARWRYLQGDAFVEVESAPTRIKTGSHFLVQLSDGRILPFAEACPEETRELEAIIRFDQPHRVFSIREVSIAPALVKRLSAHAQRSLGLSS